MNEFGNEIRTDYAGQVRRGLMINRWLCFGAASFLFAFPGVSQSGEPGVVEVKTIEIKTPESQPVTQHENRREYQRESRHHNPSGDVRRPPADRFDFRGEHAGTIYTPGGWRRLNVDPAMVGPDFLVPYEQDGGETFYVPFPYNRSGRSGRRGDYGRGYSSGQGREFIGLGSSYEIVRPKKPAAEESQQSGHWELRAEQIPVPGEFVDVYHPAVYEVDDAGKHQLVEAAETTRVPKVKIVLRKTWVQP